jgi:hypothetical protein
VIWGAKKLLLRIFSTTFFVVSGAPFWYFSQRYSDFDIATPLSPEDILIIGFMGGRDPWDSKHVGVGRTAIALRDRNLENVHIVTVQNTHRHLALRLVRKAFDRDQDGMLSPLEVQAARVILYGQSWGGAAVVKFARQLERIGVPVMLSVQVDSVGISDGEIPANVCRAANFYQNNGRIIRGEPEIRADDPTRTTILFNQRHDYANKEVQMRKLPWWRTLIRTDHLKMDSDQEVWDHVERLIVEEITSSTR